MSNFVFLIDANKNPMNPIHPAHARELMERGKAAVFRRYPFTLIMKRTVENIVTYPLSLRIDPGSKITGISLVNNRDEVVWGMELQHRGQAIKDSLETRRAVRRGRRQRNTRYRQARFLNRTRPKGWLAPSLMHRVLTTETWVKRLIKFAPIGEIRQELVRFDTQKMQNPEVSGVEYSQGELAGYETREYLLEKWGRKCTYCSKKDIPLQIEHIVPRAKGGSNRVSNLCLACEPCNQKKGTQDLADFLKGKPDLASRILKQAKAPLKDAAAVNSTRWKLLETLKAFGFPVVTGTGGQTKYNRTRLGLSKTHWLDAACVGVVEVLKVLITKPLHVIARGQGGRQKAALNKYGYPVRHNPLKPIKGWCSGDMAKHLETGTVGRVNPRSQSNSFNFTPLGGKAFSVHVQKLFRVHRKDGYVYQV